MPESDAQQVTIRMYGQGVGDCFLLSFPRSEGEGDAGKRVHVLIDCGVVGGTPGGAERMRQVVADIRTASGGYIDLLVVTHEHWDHLSGFVQARAEWDNIEVGALWTAWTEKSESGLPDVLRTIREKQRKTLAAAADRALQFGVGDRYSTLLGLMAFLSDAAGQGVGFSAAAATLSDAFDFAKKHAHEQVFCEPGEVRRVPGTSAVAYVLGPPRGDARLRQIEPSVRHETYSDKNEAERRAAVALALAELNKTLSLERMANGRSEFNAIAMPLLLQANAFGADGSAPDTDPDARRGDAMERDLLDRSYPFEASLRIALPIAEEEARNPATPYVGLSSYFDEVHYWRNIDQDWLGAAEALALRADHLTNNTSLVLAFELPGTRSVLLFAGDAQVGNWLSWDDIPKWVPVNGATPSQAAPDIADLLARTVFYKVGHHGSHNATLKAQGLERMRDDGALTAFVPVSTAVARQLKHWRQMPLDALLEAMSTRTRQRVVTPHGTTWVRDSDEAVPAGRPPDWLRVSSERLGPIRDRSGAQLQGEVPLWVEVDIAASAGGA